MPSPEEVAAAMRLLGFDPEQTQAVVLTADTAVAISTDYPEPLDPPQQEEITDAE